MNGRSFAPMPVCAQAHENDDAANAERIDDASDPIHCAARASVFLHGPLSLAPIFGFNNFNGDKHLRQRSFRH
jgi:hypothetical protein